MALTNIALSLHRFGSRIGFFIMDKDTIEESEIYVFKINNLTPENMPFGRLVEYYSEISKMIGMADNMHLVDIVKSSHASQFKVDRVTGGKIEDLMINIMIDNAPKASMKAYDNINRMLVEDSTSAEFSSPFGDNIIAFPGKKSADEFELSIMDAATFTGELYHIAGTANDAKIRIDTDSYGKVKCSSSKDIAKSLREYLFEDIRVSGRGMWRKSSDGNWTIDDFVITDFKNIQKESLSKTIIRLRRIDVNWPKDPIQAITETEGSGIQ